jgi:hypothetical protein
MKLIESKTLATAAASIEFTSIPQTFTDLVLLISARNDTSNAVAGLISFNGNTANFSSRFLTSDGSSASSGTFARFACSFQDDNTANTFNNGALYIPNYSGATHKSYSSDQATENNATGNNMGIIAGLWANTAAITSLAISPASGNLRIGSTISLYGVLKGSDGIVTTS